jgi:hypothetical protein
MRQGSSGDHVDGNKGRPDDHDSADIIVAAHKASMCARKIGNVGSMLSLRIQSF